MDLKQQEFVAAAIQKFGANAILDRTKISQIIADNTNLAYPYWLVTQEDYRVDRGQYQIPSLDGSVANDSEGATAEQNITSNAVAETTPAPSSTKLVTPQAALEARQIVRMAKLYDESQPTIPQPFEGYVPFGFYQDMLTLIASKRFFPHMITGLSGNGKTLMVEQACAKAKREMIRVNISIETDQADLLGSSELVNGNTVKREGPVLLAMRHGVVLLLDEIDRGSNKLMCLQSILEGKPYFDKGSGETVYPKKGFQIIATANTKGKGSEDGRYLAQILDDAFLERFPVTVEQDYPTEKTELKILNTALEQEGKTPDGFTDILVNWASTIRKSYIQGSLSELISTRRLVDICKAYAIYGDRTKAITLCTNRFDDEVRNGFMDYYTKLDESIKPNAPINMESSTADIWMQEVENA